MTTLIFLAVLIAITTTITALLTGRFLSEKKRKLFFSAGTFYLFVSFRCSPPPLLLLCCASSFICR